MTFSPKNREARPSDDVVFEIEDVFERLQKLEIRLPADNAETQKDQHNITLENYCKLALELAETSENLRTHLEAILTSSEGLTTQQADDIFVLWAPVAEIMGWYDIKTRLEEAAFRRKYPETAAAIARAYEHLGGDAELEALNDSYVSGLSAILIEQLSGVPVTVRVTGRRKSDYSVWRKSVKKGATDYVLPDFFGIRVIIEPTSEDGELAAVEGCYMVCDVLSQCFEPDLNRFKNYIVHPKPNGYQSIHMSLEDINGAPLECQIRTADMHERAEYDPNASHLIYEATQKVAEGRFMPRDHRRRNRIYNWREEAAYKIRERQAKGDLDLKGLRGERKLLFSPDGNIYELDPGATVLDFSFAVHSTDALKTKGVVVNGVSQALSHVPSYGDIVAATYSTDGHATWTDGWQGLVKSDRARSQLRRERRRRDQAELIASGEERLDRFFRAYGLLDWGAYLTEQDRGAVAELYGLNDFETLLVKIAMAEVKPLRNKKRKGRRKPQPVEGMGHIINQIEANIRVLSGIAQGVQDKTKEGSSLEVELREGHGIAVLNTLGCRYHFAQCCSDLTPADHPVAIISSQNSDFAIHRHDCNNLSADKPQLSSKWHAIA